MLKKLFNKRYTIEMFKNMIKRKSPDLKEMQKALDNGVDIDFVVNKFKKRIGVKNHPSIHRILDLNEEINSKLK